MKAHSLIVLAGGASSRMKRSLGNTALAKEVREAAQHLHKSLIPLDKAGRPLLFYLLRNAVSAGITKVYVITSEENSAFVAFASAILALPEFKALQLRFAVQHIPIGKQKPMGTADALQQCLAQYPGLLAEKFTVCNGDNLYSVDTLKQLRGPRSTAHALIAYEGKALGLPQEKIEKFALLDFDRTHLLTQILEKPTEQELTAYRLRHRKLWVSMNVFSFSGAEFIPFLEQCPVHPVRQERELPQALQLAVQAQPGSVTCFPKAERIPDLTQASDIANFFKA